MGFPKFSPQSFMNGIVFWSGILFIISIVSVGYAAWNASMSKVWSGSGLTANGWNAVIDNINDLNTRLSSLPAESDPTVNSLGKASLSCSSGQIAKWNGSAWSCSADSGITAESDPQVGTLTSGMWCTTNGTAVNCTSAAPSVPVGTLCWWSNGTTLFDTKILCQWVNPYSSCPTWFTRAADASSVYYFCVKN